MDNSPPTVAPTSEAGPPDAGAMFPPTSSSRPNRTDAEFTALRCTAMPQGGLNS
ncbi:hypothetical protein ACFXGA_23160 [Actinosynnema sp. NPDC059335]|uniref:hypothetical protein n=1 Tax=Actinosynnema sp. NPDC059335 TaxID=3346804 RepID=UPI00366BB6D4